MSISRSLGGSTLQDLPIGTLIETHTVMENGQPVVYEVRRAEPRIMPRTTGRALDRNVEPIPPAARMEVDRDPAAPPTVAQLGGFRFS